MRSHGSGGCHLGSRTAQEVAIFSTESGGLCGCRQPGTPGGIFRGDDVRLRCPRLRKVASHVDHTSASDLLCQETLKSERSVSLREGLHRNRAFR